MSFSVPVVLVASCSILTVLNNDTHIETVKVQAADLWRFYILASQAFTFLSEKDLVGTGWNEVCRLGFQHGYNTSFIAKAKLEIATTTSTVSETTKMTKYNFTKVTTIIENNKNKIQSNYNFQKDVPVNCSSSIDININAQTRRKSLCRF